MVSLVSFFLLWHRTRRRRTDYDISWTFKEVILIKLHDNRKFIIQIQLYVLNSKRFPCHLMELRKNCYTKLWAAKWKRQRARKEKRSSLDLKQLNEPHLHALYIVATEMLTPDRNKTTTNHQNGNSTIGFVWPHLNRSVRALERTNMVLYISNYTFSLHSWLRPTTATHRLRKKSRSDHSQIVTKYINYAEPKCDLFKLISNQIWSPEEIFALFIAFDLLDWVPNSSVKSYACFGIGCDQY